MQLQPLLMLLVLVARGACELLVEQAKLTQTGREGRLASARVRVH